MADRLVVSDLVVECRIGVSDAEQAKPQRIWIDLELTIDAAKAAVSDDLRASIDYAHLVTVVRQLVQSRPCRLLETMAEEVARLVLREFHTPRVLVRLKKRALPEVGAAAVEIVRGVTR